MQFCKTSSMCGRGWLSSIFLLNNHQWRHPRCPSDSDSSLFKACETASLTANGSLHNFWYWTGSTSERTFTLCTKPAAKPKGSVKFTTTWLCRRSKWCIPYIKKQSSEEIHTKQLCSTRYNVEWILCTVTVIANSNGKAPHNWNSLFHICHQMYIRHSKGNTVSEKCWQYRFSRRIEKAVPVSTSSSVSTDIPPSACKETVRCCFCLIDRGISMLKNVRHSNFLGIAGGYRTTTNSRKMSNFTTLSAFEMFSWALRGVCEMWCSATVEACFCIQFFQWFIWCNLKMWTYDLCHHHSFAPAHGQTCITLTEVSVHSIALTSATADSIFPMIVIAFCRMRSIFYSSVYVKCMSSLYLPQTHWSRSSQEAHAEQPLTAH